MSYDSVSEKIQCFQMTPQEYQNRLLYICGLQCQTLLYCMLLFFMLFSCCVNYCDALNLFLFMYSIQYWYGFFNAISNIDIFYLGCMRKVWEIYSKKKNFSLFSCKLKHTISIEFSCLNLKVMEDDEAACLLTNAVLLFFNCDCYSSLAYPELTSLSL